MLIALLAVPVLATGCADKSPLFRNWENRDLRSLTLTSHENAKAQEIYTERGVTYTRLPPGVGVTHVTHHRHYVHHGPSGSAGDQAMVGGIIGLVVLAVVATDQGIKTETEKRRTGRMLEGIDADTIRTKLEAELDRQVRAGLAGAGYEVHDADPVVHDKIEADKPLHPNRELPAFSATQATRSMPAGGDATLLVDLRNWGVEKIGGGQFMPYVVVSATLHRGDTGEAVHRQSYLGTPADPLSPDGDFDAAVADRAKLEQQYELAIADACEFLLRDLRPDFDEPTTFAANPEPAPPEPGAVAAGRPSFR